MKINVFVILASAVLAAGLTGCASHSASVPAAAVTTVTAAPSPSVVTVTAAPTPTRTVVVQVPAPAPVPVPVPVPAQVQVPVYVAPLAPTPTHSCQALFDQGYTWNDMYNYWVYLGSPSNMDNDSNGWPCETVFGPYYNHLR